MKKLSHVLFEQMPEAGWQEDILHIDCISEERSYLLRRESRNTTTDRRDQEDLVGMVACIGDEVDDIRKDSLRSTLHRRNSIRLALYPNALSPNSSEMLVSSICCPTCMRASKVTSEDKNLVFFELCDMARCNPVIHGIKY
jgi:hypothetical protein